MEHQLYREGDADAPRQIKDRNGSVVLRLCRNCGNWESLLDDNPRCLGPAVNELLEQGRLGGLESCRNLLLALRSSYVLGNFTHDPETDDWETRDKSVQAYADGLRDAAAAVAAMACEEFGHDWPPWVSTTRRVCRRCGARQSGGPI